MASVDDIIEHGQSIVSGEAAADKVLAQNVLAAVTAIVGAEWMTALRPTIEFHPRYTTYELVISAGQHLYFVRQGQDADSKNPIFYLTPANNQDIRLFFQTRDEFAVAMYRLCTPGAGYR